MKSKIQQDLEQMPTVDHTDRLIQSEQTVTNRNIMPGFFQPPSLLQGQHMSRKRKLHEVSMAPIAGQVGGRRRGKQNRTLKHKSKKPYHIIITPLANGSAEITLNL
jgi:hypothetical protein